MSELLIDGKDTFKCFCCNKEYDCDKAVMIKDNKNNEDFICYNCYEKIFIPYSYFRYSMELKEK